MTKPHYRRDHADPLMTTRETAQLLGVSLRTVQLWDTAGTLPAGRTPGGHRRIRKSDVLAFAERSGLRPARQTATATTAATTGNEQLDALAAEVARLKTVLKDMLTIAKRIGIGDTPPAIAAANALGEAL